LAGEGHIFSYRHVLVAADLVRAGLY
jgi:hypothetical protein